jgi:hypothetical protein
MKPPPSPCAWPTARADRLVRDPGIKTTNIRRRRRGYDDTDPCAFWSPPAGCLSSRCPAWSGIPGGTLDKLESIPGFRIGLSVTRPCGSAGRRAPSSWDSPTACARRQEVVRVRDVTGTVNSIPLIAASFMSKKIAAGADAIVLTSNRQRSVHADTGRGAGLSRTMVRIDGQPAPVAAVITAWTSRWEPTSECARGDRSDRHPPGKAGGRPS